MSETFSISQQHYLFGVQAFAHTILATGGDEYTYALRDMRTSKVIKDVADGTSELGVLVMTSANADALRAALAEANLEFVELAESTPRVALPVSHPLSNAEKLTLEDLEPWPYVRFEQGSASPAEFAEEALSYVPRSKVVTCTDRASLSELAASLNGYTITSGILVGIADGTSLTTIPLETDERLHLGYIVPRDHVLSEIGQRFVKNLRSGLARYAA